VRASDNVAKDAYRAAAKKIDNEMYTVCDQGTGLRHLVVLLQID